MTGVDSSETLIGLCRARFPSADWRVADMRSLALGRVFDALLAWHSFFHLTPDEQRAMFPVFAAHAADGAMLMFTSGPVEGVAMGTFEGEPLYHASLDPRNTGGFFGRTVSPSSTTLPTIADCGGATIWLARKD